MKKFFYTVLLLAILGGAGYGYMRYSDGINRLFNPDLAVSEMTGGVISVTNSYYYRLSMPDGRTVCFSGVGSDAFENLTFDADSVRRVTVSGVAAAVSDSGLFVTARQLVMPRLATAGEQPLRVQDLIDRLAAWIETEQRARAGAYRALGDSINDNYYIDSNNDIVERVKGREEQLKQRQRELMADIRAARELLAQVKALDPAQVRFECVSHVTARLVNTKLDSNLNDTIPCVLMPLNADDDEVAFLRLADGITPAGVPVFDQPGNGLFGAGDGDVTVKVGDKVHLVATVRSNDSYQTAGIEGHVVQLLEGKMLVDVGSGHSSDDLCGSPVYNDSGEILAVCVKQMRDAVNFFHCQLIPSTKK